MSKQRKKKPTGGDPYRRGYGNGVTAAVDAVLDDLDAAASWTGWSTAPIGTTEPPHARDASCATRDSMCWRPGGSSLLGLNATAATRPDT
jgi:hypothetical protein